MTIYTGMKTQKEVRAAFWEDYAALGHSIRLEWKNKRQNDLPTDVRCAFVDFIDYLERNKQISRELAERVTL